MTAVMWTYSQVVWAYFILDAATLATSKFLEIPPTNLAYPIEKDDLRIQVEDINTKTNSTSKDITAKIDSLQPLSLFVAQPSSIQELLRQKTSDQVYPNTPPRYAENFGMVATSSEQQYRGIDPKLSLFSRIDKKKSHRGKKSNKLPEPRGSDRYLTPELYRFKTDIEKETVGTHVRGMKMSPDAAAAPTIVRDRPYRNFEPARYHYRDRQPGSLVREETFINPYVYDEPYSYDESPSTPYAKPVSYQQYSSIPRDPYYPSSTGSSYYEPPSDYSFPYYPTPEPEPYYYPKPAEPESYSKYSDSSYNDFPVDYPSSPPIPPINFHDTQGYFPSAKNRETAGDKEEPEDGNPANDEDDFDPEPTPKSPKKSHRNPNYEVSEYGTDPSEIDLKYPRNKKKRPRAKPRKPQTPPKEDEDEEFDSNYEPPDGFQEDKDENVDVDDSTEDEPLTPKHARLHLPSKKLEKRVRGRPSRSRNKRCVKKRKEMSVETEMASGGFDEEPSKKMTCLVCENLDTGGTYETCSYESDPKKNSYYAGNEASYRKGSSKSPYKYRMRREVVTVINSTSTPSKHIVRRSYNSDSMGSFTSDVEDFSSDDVDDDDHEDQQEDDDDDFEEYKPTRPAYANEDACTEVSKNGLTCMVCHNPETNGKYKQCSYANDPDKNNYEYAQSSSYGSKEVPYKNRNRRQPNKANKKGKPDEMQIQDTVFKEIKVPSDWKPFRSLEQKKIGAINNNFQKLLHSKEEPDTETLASISNPSYEEQFLSLFPELDNDQSSESLLGEQSLLKELNEKPFSGKSDLSSRFGNKNKIGGYFKNKSKKSILDDDEDTDMSKMMKEFKTKDRSACKKSIKDKMTCYVCDDKDGIKREECMYIVENEPTKVSYHETKQTKPEETEAESSVKREVYYKSPLKIFKYKYIPASKMKDQSGIGSTVHKTISEKPYHKHSSSVKPKRYSNVKIHTEKTYSLNTLPTKLRKQDLVGAYTEEQFTLGSNRVHRKRKPKPDLEDEEDESPDPEETGEYAAVEVVPEVDPESPDGLFSDETKDVYSTELKETLPRYMVEKNEHEKIVDSFLDKMK